jgi:uncharacterized delta-60 repeat protein
MSVGLAWRGIGRVLARGLFGLAAAAVTFLASAPVDARAGLAGVIDLEFGSDGTTLVPVAGDGGGNSVAVQPDGKIVIAGQSAWTSVSNFVAARLNVDGSLDHSFGHDGVVSIPIGQSATAAHVLVEPDGRIVLTGAAFESGRLQMALARLRPNGSLDPGFGRGGVVTETIGQAAMAMAAVRVPNGKLIVGGTAKVRDSGAGASNLADMSFAAMRLMPNGSLDPWYGDGGRVVGPGPAHAYAFGVQTDGKLVWAGETPATSGTAFAAGRATADGRIDRGYGFRGLVRIPIGQAARAVGVAVLADGSAILAGNAYTNKFVTAVLRLSPSGRPDASFAQSGVATVASARHANGLVRQPDGRLVIPETGGVSAVRLNPDGTLDGQFGDGGLFRVPLGDRAAANGAALTHDGGILLGGAVVEDGRGHLSVTRVHSGLGSF